MKTEWLVIQGNCTIFWKVSKISIGWASWGGKWDRVGENIFQRRKSYAIGQRYLQFWDVIASAQRIQLWSFVNKHNSTMPIPNATNPCPGHVTREAEVWHTLWCYKYTGHDDAFYINWRNSKEVGKGSIHRGLKCQYATSWKSTRSSSERVKTIQHQHSGYIWNPPGTVIQMRLWSGWIRGKSHRKGTCHAHTGCGICIC